MEHNCAEAICMGLFRRLCWKGVEIFSQFLCAHAHSVKNINFPSHVYVKLFVNIPRIQIVIFLKCKCLFFLSPVT